jgi:hypothetical protein
VNWEHSKTATPLKRDFLRAFFAQTKDFFLTGGSALGMFYLEHRLSYDLDLFTMSDIDWFRTSQTLRAAAERTGASLESITATPHFHRYSLARGSDKEIIDLVMEKTPQVDVEKKIIDGIIVDTLREIGTNKMCTLLGRSEIKDIIDLYFLDAEGFHIWEHLEDVGKKEGGFDPGIVSFLLSEIKVHEIPDYCIKPLSIGELTGFIESLRTRFARLALPDSES